MYGVHRARYRHLDRHQRPREDTRDRGECSSEACGEDAIRACTHGGATAIDALLQRHLGKGYAASPAPES
jgi:hypothetical protein